jgi:hypothetical protein
MHGTCRRRWRGVAHKSHRHATSTRYHAFAAGKREDRWRGGSHPARQELQTARSRHWGSRAEIEGPSGVSTCSCREHTDGPLSMPSPVWSLFVSISRSPGVLPGAHLVPEVAEALARVSRKRSRPTGSSMPTCRDIRRHLSGCRCLPQAEEYARNQTGRRGSVSSE